MGSRRLRSVSNHFWDTQKVFPAVSEPPGGQEEPETDLSDRISMKSYGSHTVGYYRDYNGEYTEFSVL